MRNISDIIEQYLKGILHKSSEGVIEIQRNDLADQFRCVPSQINYVINTRFSFEKGYVVESKRGGGGYIRIQKMDIPHDRNLHDVITAMIQNEIDQTSAEGIVYQLEECEVLSKREANMLRAAISRDTLVLPLPFRDEFRANLMKRMLVSLLIK